MTRIRRIEKMMLDSFGGITARQVMDEFQVTRQNAWRILNSAMEILPIQKVSQGNTVKYKLNVPKRLMQIAVFYSPWLPLEEKYYQQINELLEQGIDI